MEWRWRVEGGGGFEGGMGGGAPGFEEDGSGREEVGCSGDERRSCIACLGMTLAWVGTDAATDGGAGGGD